MASLIINFAAGVAAVAGLALSSIDGAVSQNAYDGDAVAKLTRADIEAHAAHVFARADRDGNASLNADEYTALTIVTAELAHLNGFIVIENDSDYAVAPAPGVTGAALSSSEQARIEAVARGRFYMFAGNDGVMDANEFKRAQNMIFEAADFNNNGVLARRELSAFAHHHANVTTGV